MNLPSWLQSSADPSQISLSIESSGKVIIGLIAWFLVSKGMNAAAATTQLQAIVDLVAQAVPLVFSLWHAMLTLWGLVRKLIMWFSLPKTQTSTVSTVQTPQG